MSNPSIAIVGLEGSGKTVLMSVLAKKLSSSPETDYYLDPVGVQTLMRVEDTWTTLQHGEWPPSTPPGEMFDLTWKLYINRHGEQIEADIRLIDLAGQDTRILFSNDDFRNSKQKHLEPLAEYISNASILLFVLNIKDYVTETDDKRRIENQAVLKSALDQLNGSKKILLAFTQYDQYRAFIEENGGLNAFCQKHIPYIYNAYLSSEKKVFGTKQIPTMCIAAVNDTQMKIDKDGTAQPVPAPNFSSRGLDELCKWLVDEICAPYDKAEQERLEREKQAKEKQLRVQRRCRMAIATIAALCVLFALFMAVSHHMEQRRLAEERKTHEEEVKNFNVPPETQAGTRQTITVDGVEYAFCWCPPETFQMGSPSSESDRDSDETQHEVTLTQGFWMLETEVTVGMWKSFTKDTSYESQGNTPYGWTGSTWEQDSKYSWRNPGFSQDDTHPMVCVSWDDAVRFCEWLSQKTGLKISLPTEAQWEYACRAGSRTPFFWGSTLNGDKANCDGNYPYGTSTKGKYLEKTAPVKSYAPNAWGLYDMHGNVWEWCEDWYGEKYYAESPSTDPTGPGGGSYRVLRGGGWLSNALCCRSARRNRDSPVHRLTCLGFRLVGLAQ